MNEIGRILRDNTVLFSSPMHYAIEAAHENGGKHDRIRSHGRWRTRLNTQI